MLTSIKIKFQCYIIINIIAMLILARVMQKILLHASIDHVDSPQWQDRVGKLYK